MNFEEMTNEIQSRLTQERFSHVLGVVETAQKLAQKLALDQERLSTAALLHDCAKYMSISDMMSYSEKYSVPISDEDRRVPAVIHARIGAFMATRDFGITDPEIIEAIRVHPTGAPGMGILARALFVCDYIEPGRNLKKTRKMTDLAFTDFEQAVLAIAIEKNKWVLKKKRPLHQEGIDFYHDQLIRLGY